MDCYSLDSLSDPCDGTISTCHSPLYSKGISHLGEKDAAKKIRWVYLGQFHAFPSTISSYLMQRGVDARHTTHTHTLYSQTLTSTHRQTHINRQRGTHSPTVTHTLTHNDPYLHTQDRLEVKCTNMLFVVLR